MAGTPVELRVGGQTYRVITSAEEAELRRLAELVEARLQRLTAPGRPVAPQSLLLAAISLAHDLEQERTRRAEVETRSREMLRSILSRIDTALEEADKAPESEPTQPDAAELAPVDDFDL
jgi:cell division protein ZapA